MKVRQESPGGCFGIRPGLSFFGLNVRSHGKRRDNRSGDLRSDVLGGASENHEGPPYSEFGSGQHPARKG